MHDTAPTTPPIHSAKHLGMWAIAAAVVATAAAYAAAVTTAWIALDATVPPLINQWVTIALGTSLACTVILAGVRTIVGNHSVRQLVAEMQTTQRQLIAEIGRLRMRERETQQQLDELYGKGYLDGVAKRRRDDLN